MRTTTIIHRRRPLRGPPLSLRRTGGSSFARTGRPAPPTLMHSRVSMGATSPPVMPVISPSDTGFPCRPAHTKPVCGRSRSHAAAEAFADGSRSVLKGVAPYAMETAARLVVLPRAPPPWTLRPTNHFPNSSQLHPSSRRTPSLHHAVLWQQLILKRWSLCCASPRTVRPFARTRRPSSSSSNRCLPHIRTLRHAHALG